MSEKDEMVVMELVVGMFVYIYMRYMFLQLILLHRNYKATLGGSITLRVSIAASLRRNLPKVGRR